MGASASLAAPALTVDPGGEAVTELKVRNTGSVVDQFVVDVLGDTGAFARVEPNVLNLFPGAEGTATIKFQPPRAAKTPAGVVPYGVRVWSKEDPEGSIVQEGQLQVGAFLDASAELLPRTSRGRRKGKHELAVDNRGNAVMNVSVSVVDPDELINARVTPSTLVAPPGAAVFQKIEIRPKKTFLKGQPKTIPFQVIVTGEGQPPVTTDGAMVQEQMLPKWLLPAALLALAGLIAAFVLWQVWLKPRIESTAKAAVAEETQALEDQAAAAEEAATEAAESAAAAEEAVAAGGGGGEPPTTVPEGGLGPNNAPTGSQSVDFRITGNVGVSPPPGTFTTLPARTVPAGQTYQITDIILQNPGGDTGRVRILRGTTTLYELGLANFRDYDYHFVTPLQFNAGEQIGVSVMCQAPSTQCTPAVSFTGYFEPVTG